MDVFRIFEVPTGGYVLMHIEDEELQYFATLEEALQVAAKRMTFSNTPRVSACP